MYDIKRDFAGTKGVYIGCAIFIAVFFVEAVIILKNIYAFISLSTITISIFYVLHFVSKTERELDEKKYNRLQNYGVLIKKVKCMYMLKIDKNQEIDTLIVKFKTPAGNLIQLERELGKREKWSDLKELDLLIDPEDYSNYRLEPEINKIK